VANPHDALFRRVFADPIQAGALLRLTLPARVAAAVDWSSLEPKPTARVDAALATGQTDLVFVARLRAHPARIVLVIEHKSYPDPALVRQLLRDTIGQWLASETAGPSAPLPAIVPLVVHHGAKPWTLPRSTRDLLGIAEPELAAALSAATLALQPAFDDLATRTEAELLARPLPPLGRLALLMLQFLRGADPDSAEAALERWAPLLLEVQAADRSGLALETVGSYVLEVTDLTADRLRTWAQRTLGRRAGDVLMSTAEKLRAEGRAEGRNEGRNEGRVEGRVEGRSEGKADLLLLQLQQRFGPLPGAVVQALRARTEADLDRIGARLLDARSLDEALGA
jgi:predicted transposase YdaD